MKKYGPFRSAKSHELTHKERQKAAAVVNNAMTPAQRLARSRTALEARWGEHRKAKNAKKASA